MLPSFLSEHFNSQPHKEADPDSGLLNFWKLNFNSQPHKEADGLLRKYLATKRIISTHSLTRRLTKKAYETAGLSAFQLTASQGGWPKILTDGFSAGVFQLTASQGGWRIWKLGKIRNFWFQLTASQGGWRRYRPENVTMITFQLTASQGGWLYYFLSITCPIVFQLTASQGGWRIGPKRKCWPMQISTHSLTRRLTLGMRLCEVADEISTHSLTRRLTFSHTVFWSSRTYFNSQPHKEADLIGDMATWEDFRISTHSLTRRLTESGERAIHVDNISTHSLTRRLTTTDVWDFWTIATFQLTASQGGWHIILKGDCELEIFQLTASQGGWHWGRLSWKQNIKISTHSLTRRLTIGDLILWIIQGISTHSLTRRLTFDDIFGVGTAEFQLTASQGGWRYEKNRLRMVQVISTHSLTRRLTVLSISNNIYSIFQLTASQGGWQQYGGVVKTLLVFQLTASQGGWLLL